MTTTETRVIRNAGVNTGPSILERAAELENLEKALHRAAGGTGSVVLVSGEAGIGKTSLVRAFVRAPDRRAGPWSGPATTWSRRARSARCATPCGAEGARSPRRWSAGDRDAVLAALLAELEDGSRPTVLVLEDVHWADDATLDVLRYLGRRVDDLPLVVVTYRDDEVGPSLQRVLGALGRPRRPPARAGPAVPIGVARLAGGTAATSAPLYRLTAGNPFFVTELVAARARRGGARHGGRRRPGPPGPPRPGRAGRPRAAVGGSVGARAPLAGACSATSGARAAERTGWWRCGPPSLAFRHELSRHAVEAAMPVAVRMHANGRVLAALLAGPDPDLARVVHHAVGRGRRGGGGRPRSGRRPRRGPARCPRPGGGAAGTGPAPRHLLDPAEEAALWQEHAATLFSLDRMPEALDAGRRAVRLGERLGEPGPLAEALIGLALVYWALAQPAECLAQPNGRSGCWPGGDSHQLAYALAYLGGLQGSIDRDVESQRSGAAAPDMARRLDAPHLVALGEIARGTARLKQGDPAGVDDLAAGTARAAALSVHVFAMTGYVMLVQDLWNAGRFDEAERWIAEATSYAPERDLLFYLDHVTAYGFRLQAARGDGTPQRPGCARCSAPTRPAPSASACPSSPGCSCAAAPTTRRRSSPGRSTSQARRQPLRARPRRDGAGSSRLAHRQAPRRATTPSNCWPRAPPDRCI